MPGALQRGRTRQRRHEDMVFRAIADATRREMLVLLAQQELSAGRLAAQFEVSRPAIARHVRVLRKAGLVRERREGRERYYTLDHAPLQEALRYISALEQFWAARLDALGQHLEQRRD